MKPTGPRTSAGAQAAKISAWVEMHHKVDGSRELALHIHNASDMPIYEVELPLPSPDDEETTEFRRARTSRADNPPACAVRLDPLVRRSRTRSD